MKKTVWQSLVFVVLCVGILVFFLMAPESTTPRMPDDTDHRGRSSDYARCFSCHPTDTLPLDHVMPGGAPPTGKVKCYFCHKVAKPD